MFKLPLGYDNFGKIIRIGLPFVDKSLFIKQILDNTEDEVILITRPRRFGKTLNLSMLQYFFADSAYGESTAGLFDQLKIAQCGPEYMRHNGQYPVVFITLKGVKDHSYQIAYGNLCEIMRSAYSEHRIVLEGTALEPDHRKNYEAILNSEATEKQIRFSLKNLCECLFQHYGVKPWLLIDEYDAPLESAFVNHYYEEMRDLMRNFLGNALKSNAYLERAVITGILRISKESLFSDVNNLGSYSMLDSLYGEYFGFTETEVLEVLKKAELTEKADEVRYWYNGYKIGEMVIYNPWSIVNFINRRAFRTYWINTSGNDLIKTTLRNAGVNVKDNLKNLLEGRAIEAIISDKTVFGDLDRDENALYSLLLFSGYLKAIAVEEEEDSYRCLLTLPNREVLFFYRSVVKDWFSYVMTREGYERFLKSLVTGDMEEFIPRLEDFLLEAMSYFDSQGTHPEKFYHGFVLGLIVSLKETHQVKSNQESGYGRYDVMLIPYDKTQLGLIIEFKTVHDKALDLEIAAQQGLQQIEQKRYETELRQQGITKILKMALAFRGKAVKVLTQTGE